MDDRFRREAVPTTTCPITTARMSSTPTIISRTLIDMCHPFACEYRLRRRLGSSSCRWVSSWWPPATPPVQ